ncbi:hypothetical protein SAMN02745146_3706 [Hymenobacter daecheongensis DSM 21074]|uniref:Uncharacterized protein n=1 Tax=Hymenobacter daecheongensis DSM 21074 TaxID=1121955 RepID=A0A1M6LCD8_9BACT|nr:hypothetical protein [Hymenobacter daecheongensis]SHJ68822.1 hypothetical protein SAMN02745146_3706 [Hymenobacter daecheongensis DSM 21074]
MPDSLLLSDLDTALLALRPVVVTTLPAAPDATLGDFLHRTLRPVLKLQNERLLLTVADFVREHHIAFAGAAVVEQQRLVAELLARNVKLRYTIIGLITGLLTGPETDLYRRHRGEVNRRLLELAARRVQDQTAAVAAASQPLPPPQA